MGGANYSWRITLMEDTEEDRRYAVGEHSWPLGENPKYPIPYSTVGENLTWPEMLRKIHDERTGFGAMVLEHCRQSGESVALHYALHFAI